MQLDLFEDNRPAILLNIADEFIRSRDLSQAVSVFEQLLDEYPNDRYCAPLLKEVSEWQDTLTVINTSDPECFRDIWLRFGSITHSPLRSMVLSLLIDWIGGLPHPERIYFPPDYHFGHVLLAAGRYDETADCFFAALSDANIPRGKFMAWHADALTLANKEADAPESYLNAFLDDPSTVDVQFIKNSAIRNLYNSLCLEAVEELEEYGELAWMPVWGWFEALFALPAPQAITGTGSFDSFDFDRLIAENERPVPRIWFDMLTYAERLRVTARDSRELAAVRRLMKKTGSFMFETYLNKIRGTR